MFLIADTCRPRSSQGHYKPRTLSVNPDSLVAHLHPTTCKSAPHHVLGSAYTVLLPKVDYNKIKWCIRILWHRENKRRYISLVFEPSCHHSFCQHTKLSTIKSETNKEFHVGSSTVLTNLKLLDFGQLSNLVSIIQIHSNVPWVYSF